MWNQTLDKIDHAITPGKAANLWNADIHSLKLINSGINVVYRFEVNGHGRYLRIVHSKMRSKKEMLAMIDYLSHLIQKNAPVCKPVQSKYGNFIEKIQQAEDHFFAIVVTEVPGKLINTLPFDENMFYGRGKTLGQLHNAAETYQPNNKHHFITWENLWNDIKTHIKKEDEIVKNEFCQVDQWLKSLKQTKNNFGLIQEDYRAENILWDGTNAYVIDFDDPVYHWYAADIARPLLELYKQPREMLQCFFKNYMEGYRSVREFKDESILSFSWFLRMKNLGIYVWFKHYWSGDVTCDGKDKNIEINKRYGLIKNPMLLDFLDLSI